jgi:hypothetical protein
MDDFNLEKLAKEIVVERLKGVADAPAGAGLVAGQIIAKAIVGTQASQAPRETVAAVCRGLMSGMLVLGQDLPSTAVAILRQMGVVAAAAHQDPADLMTWAIEGIAPVAKIAGRTTRYAVQEAIEAAFMGAGQVFDATCETAGA